MKIKYKDKFNESYDFYLRLGIEGAFTPPNVVNKILQARMHYYDKDGVGAKEFFYRIDSGLDISMGCKEIDQYIIVEKGKALINFYIDEWVDGYNKGLSVPYEILEHISESKYPLWVKEAYLVRIGGCVHDAVIKLFR